MSVGWFEATGVFGWIIGTLTLLLLLAGIVAAVVRVPRGACIALLVGCQLPLFAGLAGMMIGRAKTDDYVSKSKPPKESDRAVGYAEADRILYFGLAGMLVCDAAAATALVRSRKPETSAPPTS